MVNCILSYFNAIKANLLHPHTNTLKTRKAGCTLDYANFPNKISECCIHALTCINFIF